MPSPPLTPEQLSFFTEQTQRAVDKAQRKHRRRSTTGFLVLLLGLLIAFWTQGHDSTESRKAIVTSGRAVAVDSCNGRYQDRQGLRNLLFAAEAQIPAALKKGEITPDQAETAIQFYNGQLKKLKLPDCRKAARVITDNPAHTVKIPKPLFPPASPLPAPHDSIFAG